MVNPAVPNMAMVNVNNFLNVKDSRWLQLEVCREFQRNKCTRPDTECKFAHPPANVEVQNGRVTACYDSIKGRCNREKPPCKYFHPPQHLKDQLLINGRNHLALKNAIMTQIQGLSPGTQLVPGTLPVSCSGGYLYNLDSVKPELCYSPANSPYLAGIPTMTSFNPYIASSPVMTMSMSDGSANLVGMPQQVVAAQKVPRTDRLEAFPGMGVPYKRTAGDKSGMPVYQPTGNAAYQQALMQQLGGQSFVPVSCEYGGNMPLAGVGSQAGSSQDSTANHHAAASSTQPTPPPSSSSSSITNNSSPLGKITFSLPATASTSSTSSSSSTGGSVRDITSSPTLAQQAPVSVFSYTGYALSKGLRPQFKQPNRLPPGSMTVTGYASHGFTSPQMSQFTYGSSQLPGMTSMSPFASSGPQIMVTAGMGGAMMGLHHPNFTHGMGGMTTGGMTVGGISPGGVVPTLGGLGSGMSLMSHQQALVMPQFPSPSSLYMPQYTALSSSAHYSLTQGSEQPYKKLKTS